MVCESHIQKTSWSTALILNTLSRVTELKEITEAFSRESWHDSQQTFPHLNSQEINNKRQGPHRGPEPAGLSWARWPEPSCFSPAPAPSPSSPLQPTCHCPLPVPCLSQTKSWLLPGAHPHPLPLSLLMFALVCTRSARGSQPAPELGAPSSARPACMLTSSCSCGHWVSVSPFPDPRGH